MKKEIPSQKGISKEYVGYKHPPKHSQFKKGEIHNPTGYKGEDVSIVAEIKKKFTEITEGQKKTYLEIFLIKLFKKTMVDEDGTMMRDLIDRIDGKPKQFIEGNASDQTINSILEKLADILK